MSLDQRLYLKAKIEVDYKIENILCEKNIEYSKNSNYFDVFDKLGFLIYFSYSRNDYFDYVVNGEMSDFEWNEDCTHVSYRLDKFSDIYQTNMNMLDITFRLLNDTNADAILGSEVLILKRDNNIIKLNETNNFWSIGDYKEKAIKELPTLQLGIDPRSLLQK